MTLAIAVKVNAGVILAADSATTVTDQNGGVINVYNNANKIFNLYKGLPIGIVTWGQASLGPYSISVLAKDFRAELKSSSQYAIDPQSYTVADIADKFKQFIFDNHYELNFPLGGLRPPLGFFIGGFSANSGLGEIYSLEMSAAGLSGPVLSAPPDVSGVLFNGQPEAVIRLILGFGSEIGLALEQDLGVPASDVPRYITAIQNRLANPFIYDGMPLQDTIDFAEFLVDMTIKYMRFLPGAQTVGGPIEVAAMTKHEGFKWIKRKLYFPPDLNP